MATLARFHLAARGFVADRGAETWFGSSESSRSPAVGERLTQLADYQRQWDQLVGRARKTVSGRADWTGLLVDVDRLFGRGAAAVAGQLQTVQPTGYRCQPCLRDIWHDHLLWTGDRVTGLIDPGSCRSDNVAIDLSRLLGSLVGDDTAAWDRGLAAYDRELIDQQVLDVAEVHRECDRLVGLSVEQRLELPWMHPGRADVIAAGALIVSRVLARTRATELVVSESDILDGIAWDLVQRWAQRLARPPA